MKDVMREKIEFIHDNKDAILENLGIVGYDLFTILSNDDSLLELNEYKKIKEFLNNSKAKTIYTIKDELYILYYLLSVLDKISMNLEEKEKNKSKISKYIEYINKDNNDVYVKTIKRTA